MATISFDVTRKEAGTKGEMDMRQMQTTIEVRVPELTYRHTVMDTF